MLALHLVCLIGERVHMHVQLHAQWNTEVYYGKAWLKVLH